MIGSVQKSGNLRQSASGCMADFNNCRSGKRGRKARKSRKGRRR